MVAQPPSAKCKSDIIFYRSSLWTFLYSWQFCLPSKIFWYHCNLSSSCYSPTFSLAAIVAFFMSFGEVGLLSSLLVLPPTQWYENFFKCIEHRYRLIECAAADMYITRECGMCQKNRHKRQKDPKFICWNLLIIYADDFFPVQYYLKARFHFNKKQYADLMLIANLSGVISQVCLNN